MLQKGHSFYQKYLLKKLAPNIYGTQHKRQLAETTLLALLWPARDEENSADYEQPLLLTHLFQMHPFSTPWKHQKILQFSDAFSW